MKPIIKSISIAIVILMAISMLAACGAKGNSFTCADVADGGATQQRWLRDFDSTVIINPDAVGEDSYTNDADNLSLSLGLVDESGNVTKTVNDAFFILESKTANGKGGSVVSEPVFESGADGAVKGLGKLLVNNSTGRHFIGTANDKQDTTLRLQSWNWDMTDPAIKDVYFVVDARSVDAVMGLSITLGNPYVVLYEPLQIDKPGIYIFNVYEQIRSSSPDQGGNFRTIAPEMRLTMNGNFDFEAYFCTFEDGCSSSPVKATHKWTPYSISSALSYSNATAIETEDIIMGQSVSRKITCTAAGELAFAGKLYGTPTINTKTNTIIVACDGFNYVIAPKRKGTITYYNSLEDLKAATNGSEEYSGQSYWAMKATNMAIGDSFNVGIAISDTLSADELNELAGTASSTTKVNRYLEDVEDRWNTFISENDVSSYIAKIPE